MTILLENSGRFFAPSSSSKRRRRERLCRAKATSSKPNESSTTKTPVSATKKTDVMMMSGKTQRRRDVFAVGFFSLSGCFFFEGKRVCLRHGRLERLRTDLRLLERRLRRAAKVARGDDATVDGW